MLLAGASLDPRALRDTQLGIAELAHLLGFAHAPAFHRAFRRWFGATPNAYREVKSEHPAAHFLETALSLASAQRRLQNAPLESLCAALLA